MTRTISTGDLVYDGTTSRPRPAQRADLLPVEGDPEGVTELGDRVRAAHLDGTEVSGRSS
jgi:hypothetical protein